jgi:hypothetical protein
MNNDIERPNTVLGLLDKRAQLAGKLKYLRAEERKVICDLDHIDAAIRLFNAKPNEDRIVRYPTKHRAKKGEVVRMVVRLLKNATKPITSLDIVLVQIEERGLKTDDETVILMRKRVGACLNKLKNEGVVRVVPQAGLYHGWEWVR